MGYLQSGRSGALCGKIKAHASPVVSIARLARFKHCLDWGVTQSRCIHSESDVGWFLGGERYVLVGQDTEPCYKNHVLSLD